MARREQLRPGQVVYCASFNESDEAYPGTVRGFDDYGRVMVEFDDGTFNIARRQLSLAPSGVEPKAARKRKIAAEDTPAEETTERRASKPRPAHKRKTAAESAVQASSDAQPTQATPQAAASKKRKAAPVAAKKTTPAAKKAKSAPPPVASQVAPSSQSGSVYTGVCKSNSSCDTINQSTNPWQSRIQIGGKTRNLGHYQSEKDAARARDKVASVLGRSLNFPSSKPVELVGQRSAGADELVAGAVEAAKRFVEAAKKAKTASQVTPSSQSDSIYTGVQKRHSGRNQTNPWAPQIKIGGKTWYLGQYQSEKDAAQAFDKVASVLGRTLNFTNSKPVKIVGQRSAGADELLADAIEAAKSFMASGANIKASIYRGVKHQKQGGHRWASQIKFDGKHWNLGQYEIEKDAARAYDKVASALGRPLNFAKPAKIIGQTSKGADKRVADAVKAANAFVLSQESGEANQRHDDADAQSAVVKEEDDDDGYVSEASTVGMPNSEDQVIKEEEEEEEEDGYISVASTVKMVNSDDESDWE